MASKQHTVIVVPHARARFRRFHFTSRQLVVACAGLALLTVFALASVWTALTHRSQTGRLQALREENLQLRELNRSIEQSVRELQADLHEYEDRTQKLAIVAGISPEVGTSRSATATDAGVGGPFAPIPNVGGLDQRSAALGLRLDVIEERLDERRRLLAGTPSIAPVGGLVTSGYGYRADPITGQRAFHRGIDISTERGSEVLAPADGIVVKAGRSGSLGRAVHLVHEGGISTRFGHLSQIGVAAGQRVHRGEVLGKVGNTGRATGYHLHYEVFDDGRSRNPLEYMLDR